MTNDSEQLARMMQQQTAPDELERRALADELERRFSRHASEMMEHAAKLAAAATAEEDDIERARRFSRSAVIMPAEAVDFDHETLPPRPPSPPSPTLELEPWATVGLDGIAEIVEAGVEAGTAAADYGGPVPRSVRIARFVRYALVAAAREAAACACAEGIIDAAAAGKTAAEPASGWCVECGADLFGECAEGSICQACAECSPEELEP